MPGKKWEAREITLLKKLYRGSKSSPQEIADMLGRTRNAVILKAGFLGLRRGWTDEDVEYLKQAYPDLSISLYDICIKLNKSRTVVCEKAVYLGMRRDTHRLWDTVDIKYLREHIDDPIDELSKNLNRSNRAVWEEARRLGLTNGQIRWHHKLNRDRDRKTAVKKFGRKCMIKGCLGFEKVTEVHHAPDGKLWVLCPSHHAMITRHHADTDGDKYILLDC